jgi:hypothetical protein
VELPPDVLATVEAALHRVPLTGPAIERRLGASGAP